MEIATTTKGNHDLISSLPIEMLQLILCSIPTVEAVRISTLSRTWLYAWNSLPLFTLNFSCQTEHPEDTIILVSKFDESISILNKKEDPMPVSFRVSWPSFLKGYSHENCLDEWMRLVSKHRVRELEIDTLLEESENVDFWWTYDFPDETLFLVAESLVVLKLRGCTMPWQSLKIKNTNFLSLRVLLWEDYFHLDRNDDLEELLHLCPVLEECTIISPVWDRLPCFVLSDHRKLKHVRLEGLSCVMLGDLPNLQVLEFSKFGYILVCDEDRDRYNGLKKLSLRIGFHFGNYDLVKSFIHRLPSLESLVVKSDRCSVSISELGIQDFRFPSSVEPPKLEIHAPRLCFYKYRSSVVPPTCAFKRIDLVLTLLDRDETIWFFKGLRSNLVNLAPYNLVLTVTLNAKEFLPKALPPIDGHSPFFVDSLELQEIPSSLMGNMYLIKWLFWCCPPLQLTTRPSHIFLQSFRSMIWDAKLRGDCCNCTCPSLRAVKVETQYGIKDFKDIKVNEDSELLSEDVLKFRLEWF